MQGPTASNEQGGSPTPTPNHKRQKHFSSSILFSSFEMITYRNQAERRGLSRVVQGFIASSGIGHVSSPVCSGGKTLRQHAMHLILFERSL